MYRVLKPGGRALIIDLRSDASRESINEAVDGMGLSAANRVITKLTFRFMLLKRSYSRMGFEELVAQTEFHGAEIREDLIGLEVLVSKERPRFLIW
jgi:ubiquinone/menaquinone biosynthesis C-methylase UbiE